MSPEEQPARCVERIPRATYRLQFNEHFRLPDALALVPYLSELGISHLYSSPLLQALPHSTHGYDVCDFGQLNPELGTEHDFDQLVSALHRCGMGLVLDIVPNHMGVSGPENRWWWDVLKRGQSSPFAGHFDIDWQSPDPRLTGKVLAPSLGKRYQDCLEQDDLRLQFEHGEVILSCSGQSFPVAPQSLMYLFKRAGERCPSRELIDLVESLVRTAPAGPNSLHSDLERRCLANPSIAETLTKAVDSMNEDLGFLDELIQQQHYRLAFWGHGDEEINYRRFFNITSLAAIRADDERVLKDVHVMVRRWVDEGKVDALRVDHVDGLRDPEHYLRWVRDKAPKVWLVAEKILGRGESLPGTWPVAGTTGYDFVNQVAGVFIDPSGEEQLTSFCQAFTDQPTDYPEVVLQKKKLVLREIFVAETKRLTAILLRICARHWRYRDFTSRELQEAIIQFAACLQVYRTYVRPEAGLVSEADREYIMQAAAMAKLQTSDLEPTSFDFLADVLLLRLTGLSESDFVARFQQLTGAATAKGMEDTAFYCFNRLISLNEVGGDPGSFGLAIDAFHQSCLDRLAHWPNSMLATSTHDTKRSEDVRARLNLLSEIPEQWSKAVLRWSSMNDRHRRDGWPDRNLEYHFYQSIFGAWPIELGRALAYIEKAACEAKCHTAWARRNAPYEAAVRGFVTGVLEDPEFNADMAQFVALLTDAGYINSLAQTLIKLTAPGVPDIYQGSELWDFSLVDPDNRRPMDFSVRRRLLAELPGLPIECIWQRRNEGLPKLWLIRQGLALRRCHPDWFGETSAYTPLFARGEKAQRVLAFRRGGALTVVPRLILGVKGEWTDTSLELPPGVWFNELSGEQIAGPWVPMAELLVSFPVALLSRKGID